MRASVIIPTFNRAHRIEATLRSVLAQEYGDVEILIVDDGSSDDTESVVRRFTEEIMDSQKRILYFRQENSGACVARNRGMMHATGKYMLFLDSDDLLMPDMLDAQIKLIESEGSDCSICDFECLDEQGTVIERRENNLHPHDFIRKYRSPHVSTVVMRRSSIPPGLQWNAALKRTQDVDFIFKYFASIENWSYINRPLFRYCLHGGGRISDSYNQGIQYGVMRRSFESYIKNNRVFIRADPDRLKQSYFSELWKHQLKDALARVLPASMKRQIKKLRGRRA